MTHPETPTAPDGAKLCAWCGETIRQSGVGRSRDYCRRSCRQRAYEDRKNREANREAVVAAVASAVARSRTNSSRVETERPANSTRDETPAIPAPAPAPVVPLAPAARRPVSRRRSTMTASPFPILPPEQLPLDE